MLVTQTDKGCHRTAKGCLQEQVQPTSIIEYRCYCLVYLLHYHVNDVSVPTLVDRGGGGGVPHRKNELEAYLAVSVPSAGVSNVCKAKKTYVLLLVQSKEHMNKNRSFDG